MSPRFARFDRRPERVLALSFALSFALLGLDAGIGSRARAAEVPASAYSASLGAVADYFDRAELIYLHPQRAAELPRQILFRNTGAVATLGGGVWTMGAQRVFLLSDQSSYWRESYGRVTVPALRGGWAGRIGAVRLGVGASGAVRKDSQIREGLSYDSSTRRYTYSYQVEETTWRSGDLLLGVGVGRGRRTLDLTFESTWEKRDEGVINARQTNTTSDTSVVSFEGDERPRPGVHLRSSWPLSERLDCLLLADWAGYEERRPGRFQGVLFDTPVDSSRVETGYRDAWRAGLGFSRAIEPLDFVLVSGTYTSLRYPIFVPDSYGPQRQYTSERRFQLSTSIREKLTRELVLLAGIQRTYSLRKTTTEAVGYSGDSYSFGRTRDDFMSSEVSWGLDWRWRNLGLTGRMSSTLRFDYLFHSLDLDLTF